MEKEKLRALQLAQLTIMEDIHRICVEHKLRYYLIGGSAIGAVRHKGFIPWDVDIDIAMPRKDYDEFVDVYSHELKSRYKCLSYKTEKKYWPPHAIVIMKDSMIVDKNGSRRTGLRPSEIFVDVLPLDICPENEWSQRKQASTLILIKKIKRWKAAWIYEENGLFKRLVKKTMKCLLWPFSWHFLNAWQERVMKRYDATSHSGLWCSMVSHYGYKRLSMPESIFGSPKLYDYEYTQLYVPEKVEEYLTLLFGDYMRLPSEKDQNKQMNVFIDAKW